MNDDDAKIKGREAVIIISFFVSVFVFAVLKVSADWKAALAQERIGKTLDFLASVYYNERYLTDWCGRSENKKDDLCRTH